MGNFLAVDALIPIFCACVMCVWGVYMCTFMKIIIVIVVYLHVVVIVVRQSWSLSGVPCSSCGDVLSPRSEAPQTHTHHYESASQRMRPNDPNATVRSECERQNRQDFCRVVLHAY